MKNQNKETSLAGTAVTAIFDIGKTNKKFLLFNESLSVVYERSDTLKETKDEDGFSSENVQLLKEWMFREFEAVVRDQTFKIGAINFSGYGATLVHIGKNGDPVTPIYNYLKPYPEKLAGELYQLYGGRETFALETASPPMGMLNSGLQLYRIKKEKPDLFRRIEKTMHLPQYLSYLFTGKFSADPTSIGCHTAMWNFKENRYHCWLKDEGVLQLLPTPSPVQTIFEGTVPGKTFQSGIGIHDSSAALAPYLTAFNEPFIQLSTGTWSIAMNPFNAEPLTFEELERDCLNYINIYGKPVKASRFLMGGEYAHQLKRMGRYFDRDPDQLDCTPDEALLQKLIRSHDPEKKLILEQANTSGPYPVKRDEEWDLSRFHSYDEAAHQLLLDLASIQVDSLKLAEGSKKIPQIIITGGFAKNQFFCRLLAAMLPGKNVYTASVPEASALGAALVLKQQTLTNDNLKKHLGLKLQQPFEGVGEIQYSWA
jgi:sugar (pentulose or hexulose) kinase